MLSSERPDKSFFIVLDTIHVYKVNNTYYMVLAGEEIKAPNELPIDLKSIDSTREEFLKNLELSTRNTGFSHLYYDLLKIELTKPQNINQP